MDYNVHGILLLLMVTFIFVIEISTSESSGEVINIDIRSSNDQEVADFELQIKEVHSSKHDSQQEDPSSDKLLKADNGKDYILDASSKEDYDDKNYDTQLEDVIDSSAADSSVKGFPSTDHASGRQGGHFERHSSLYVKEKQEPIRHSTMHLKAPEERQRAVEQEPEGERLEHFESLERQVSKLEADGQYPEEEILYIKRSKSRLHDSASDVVEALMDHPSEHNEGISEESQNEDSAEIIDASSDTSSVDYCSMDSHSFSDEQTCSSGSEYEILPRMNEEYSELLEDEMKKKAKERNSRLSDSEDSKCEYRKHFGPNRGIEDRSLCPFEWTLTERNPSRIPEYLLTANCSCQISNPKGGQIGRCIEIKSKIPVLWRIHCKGGKHVYKEGWEEINVACVPVGRNIRKIKQGHIAKIKSSA